MINRLLEKIYLHKLLTFKRFLITAIPSFFLLLLTALMLGWFVQFESSSFQQTQLELATASVKGSVHHLQQLVSQRRQAVNSMIQVNRQLLIDIADFPVDEENLEKLKSTVNSWFPDNFTYLLTDPDGIPLLEEKVLKLGAECKVGLKLFSHSPELHHKTIVMHGLTENDYHFDIMADIEKKDRSPIFFISYKIQPLVDLLKDSQIPGQSLLVVNNINPSQIELSTEGVYQSAWHGNILSQNLLENVLYKKAVPGTGWSILALSNTDLVSEYRNKLQFRSVMAYLLLLSVLIIFLWRLWGEEKSRLLAEEGLKISNDELERKVIQRTQELKNSKQDLQQIFLSAPYGMMVVNENRVIELINNRAEEIFGYDEKELLNQPMEMLLPEKARHDHMAHQQNFDAMSKSRLMGNGRNLKGRKKNGAEFAVEIGLSPLEHSTGNKVIVSIADISELVIAQKKLMEEHERAVVTLNSIGDGVITTDIDGQIDSINPIAELLSGWQAKDAIGRNISQVFMVLNEKTGKKVDDPVIECLHKKDIVELGADTVLVHRQGMEIPIEDSAAPIYSTDGTILGAVLVFHDVSQSRAHANEIEFQANHDALTGLLNRREFDRRLNNAVAKSKQTGSKNILLFMDLDRFKLVNDSAGHAAGDELLKQITKLVGAQLRQRDTFARLGGDEFAVLLEFCTLDVGLKVANKLRSVVESFRFFWEGSVFSIGISVGLVPFSGTDKSLDNLLSEADAACYTAKENGRNRVQVYDAVAAKKRDESSIVNLLVDAFENDRIALYQQKIEATDSTQQEVHYELLVRMFSASGELMSPATFLPAAERYGLATTLDRWVIRTSFTWLSSHRDHFANPMVFAINLSGQTITDKFMADFIKQQFAEFDIGRHSIGFEITETAAMSDLQKARQFIEEIKQIGCKFSLDDFGSGHASYGHLKNLPVDFLKIDGMFVKDITHDQIDFSIVKSVNEVGQALGLKTIAEFVENDAIIEKLNEIGVDYLQGYAIAYPAPLDDLLN